MIGIPETATARKLLAAIWFAIFAVFGSGLFFFHRPIAFRGIALFILLPGVSGSIAGYLWGGAILDASAVKTYAASMLRGMAVTVGAHAMFAVLFAVAVAASEDLWNIRQAPTVFFWTITLGFLMVGPFMLIVGSLAAVSLRRFGSYAFRKNAIASS